MDLEATRELNDLRQNPQNCTAPKDLYDPDRYRTRTQISRGGSFPPAPTPTIEDGNILSPEDLKVVSEEPPLRDKISELGFPDLLEIRRAKQHRVTLEFKKTEIVTDGIDTEDVVGSVFRLAINNTVAAIDNQMSTVHQEIIVDEETYKLLEKRR